MLSALSWGLQTVSNEIIKVSMLAIAGVMGYFAAQNFDRVFVKALKGEYEKE